MNMGQYDITISTGSNFVKQFTIEEGGVAKDLTAYTAALYIVSTPGETSLVVFSTANGKITNGLTAGTLTLSLTPADILTIDGEFYKLEIDDGSTQTEILTGNLFVLDEEKSGVEYLIPILRLYLGDTDPLSYRYLDEWLKVSLLSAIKSLQRWWRDRYLIDDDTKLVYRNTDSTFAEDEPPIILTGDEMPIILMASILIKSGGLESNSWNLGSWKDAEYAVSNIASKDAKEKGIQMDWDRLFLYLSPPTKRLTTGSRVSFSDFGANETT